MHLNMTITSDTHPITLDSVVAPRNLFKWERLKTVLEAKHVFYKRKVSPLSSLCHTNGRVIGKANI